MSMALAAELNRLQVEVARLQSRVEALELNQRELRRRLDEAEEPLPIKRGPGRPRKVVQ